MKRTLPFALAALIGLTACAADDDVETAEEPAEVAVDPVPEPTMATVPAMPALANANDATEQQLTAAGVPADAASAIVAGRPYDSVLDLDAALPASMDEAAREELYRHVWIPIDLNSASEEEILLIPGVGARMAHEFEEYRPYRGMEEFRREIGKYVDEAEVARLERYVRLEGAM